MSDNELILEILDSQWQRLALTPNVIAFDTQEVLGASEGQGSVTIGIDDPAAEYVPDPDGNTPTDRRFRLWKPGSADPEFAGLIDKVSKQLSDGTITISGIQRGGELASKNLGRRDFLGWPYPSLVREFLRDNVGRAPWATATATNEAPDAQAINAITGQPVEGSYWGIPYTGLRPATFSTPERLDIDLGSNKLIDAIRVIPEWWTSKWYDYRVRVRTETGGFATIFTKDDQLARGDRGDLVEFSTPRLMRYVRIEVYRSVDGYPRIASAMVYQNIAEPGSATNYVAPWIENDDSGNIDYNEHVNRIVQDGAFMGAAGVGNSMVTSLAAGGVATHRFRGTASAVYFTQAEPGEADIHIDDVFQERITIPPNVFQHKGFEVTGLSLGEHTMRVTHQSGRAQIDYFSGEYQSSWRTIEENDRTIGYRGPWRDHFSTNKFGNAIKRTTDSGHLTFEFFGDELRFYGTKGPDRGILEWYIDGASQGTVDLYHASLQHRQLLFTWTGSYASHRLRVRNTGNKNASSSSATIDVDRIAGNWAHHLFMRSAHDTNLAMLGKLSEMTNSFLRLNYDGTIDLLGVVGDDTGEILRQGENDGGQVEEATIEGDWTDTVSAIVALGRGTDNHALRVFVRDKNVENAIGGIKVAKMESRDIADAYLLARMAWQTLQNSKLQKRQYRLTYSDESKLGTIRVGDLVRLYIPRLGLHGDKYRIFRRQRTYGDDGVEISIDVANRRDSLSDLLTRATRDLSVTTNTPQGVRNTIVVGGAWEQFDQNEDAVLDFFIPDKAAVLNTKLRMRLGRFRTYTRDVESGGGSTTPSGGGGTTPSGGGTTSNGTPHQHFVAAFQSLTPGSFSSKRYSVNHGTGTMGANFETENALEILSGIDVGFGGSGHTHTNPNHTHSTPAHTHSTPNHTHTTEKGIFEETSLPSNVSVVLDGVTIDSAIGGPFSPSAGTDNIFEADLTGVLNSAGWHTLTISAGSGKGRVQPFVVADVLILG